GDRGLPLLARQRRRHRFFGERGDGRHRHETAVLRLQEYVFEVGRIVDRIGGGNELYAIAAVGDVDVDDIIAVEHRLKSVGKPGDVDAEIGSALAVDGDGKLRLGRIDGQARLLEAGVLFHRVDDLVGGFAQRLAVVADKRELQAVAGAANAEAVGLHRKDAQARHLFGEVAYLGHDLLLAA